VTSRDEGIGGEATRLHDHIKGTRAIGACGCVATSRLNVKSRPVFAR